LTLFYDKFKLIDQEIIYLYFKLKLYH